MSDALRLKKKKTTRISETS